MITRPHQVLDRANEVIEGFNALPDPVHPFAKMEPEELDHYDRQLAIIKDLINRGADRKARTVDDISAGDYVRAYRHDRAVELLLLTLTRPAPQEGSCMPCALL